MAETKKRIPPYIVIDPGHGGTDPGAIGKGQTKEKDVALSVAKELERMMRDRNFMVRLTRESDFISLSDRAQLTQIIDTTCFISIHCNAATDSNASGFEVWTSPGPTKADRLATAIACSWADFFPSVKQRRDLSDNDPDKESRFAVLMKTQCPAVLVETDFISNPAMEEKMKSHKWQTDAAAAIMHGVLAWLEG